MGPGVCMVQINKSWMRSCVCIVQINKSWMRPDVCMVQIYNIYEWDQVVVWYERTNHEW
jgi:hypothetical protein